MGYKRQELPPLQQGDNEWRVKAVCREVDDVDMFYHPDGQFGPERKEYAKRALAICQYCPVIEECRDYAIKTGQEHGIWGGMTELELRRQTAAYGARTINSLDS